MSQDPDTEHSKGNGQEPRCEAAIPKNMPVDDGEQREADDAYAPHAGKVKNDAD